MELFLVGWCWRLNWARGQRLPAAAHWQTAGFGPWCHARCRPGNSSNTGSGTRTSQPTTCSSDSWLVHMHQVQRDELRHGKIMLQHAARQLFEYKTSKLIHTVYICFTDRHIASTYTSTCILHTQLKYPDWCWQMHSACTIQTAWGKSYWHVQ